MKTRKLMAYFGARETKTARAHVRSHKCTRHNEPMRVPIARDPHAVFYARK